MNSTFITKSKNYHAGNKSKQVTTTAGHHYFEDLKGNTIVYDQTNELMVIVRRTNGQYAKSDQEFEVATVPYADISNIRSSTNTAGIELLADKLIADGLLEASEKDAYLEQIMKIK